MLSRARFLFLAVSLVAAGAAVGAATPPDPAAATREESWIAAASSGGSVRFVAAGSVFQIRLQVFGPDGAKLIESGVKPGNVLEWPLALPSGERLQEGAHFCVVTVHSLSGRVTRKVGLLESRNGEATWVAPDATQLSRWQEQLVSAGVLAKGSQVSEKLYLRLVNDGESLPVAALAHDGTRAELLAGEGGLSVRTGDYFAGKDVERLRVTPEGEVGIGVEDPQAMLHVGGLIRTDQGIVFADGSVQTTAARAAASRGEVDTRGPVVTTGGTGGVVGLQGVTGVRSFESGRLLIGNAVVDEGHLFDAQHLPSPSNSDILQRVYNKGTGGAKLRYVASTGATSQLQLTDLAEFLSSIAGNNAVGLQFNVRTAGTPNNETQLAASTRMTIARSGNIGIGTTAPTTALDVIGQVRATSGVRYGDGTTQTFAYNTLPTGPIFSFPDFETSQANWAGLHFRIVGGGNSGRLEFSRDNVNFGTVCDDYFDDNNNAADVVCRSLGYSSGVLLPSISTPDGTLPILIDDMICPPHAQSIFACRILPFGTHNCSHSEDVGVTCTP